MPNFMDLPKPVRERIYRLHLVAYKQPVDFKAYKEACGYTEIADDKNSKVEKPAKIKCPSLLQVSRKVQREATPIYFGENTFALSEPESLSVWKKVTMPRHIKQVRKVTLGRWTASSSGAPGDAAWKAFSALSKLESLTLWVVEEEEVREILTGFTHRAGHRVVKWHPSLGLGPQVNLQLLRCNGIAGLRSLRGLRQVNFVKYLDMDSNDPGNVGSMAGGFLETVIKREIMQPRSSKDTPCQAQGPFRFLDLPPELRNMIYGMLLLFPGPTYPLAEKPLSVTSRFKFQKHTKRDAVPVPRSALEVLLVNKQIHEEAHKIFYQNDLVFSSPVETQDFMCSFGDARFESLRSLTLFCVEDSVTVNKDSGVVDTGLGAILLLMRRLKGLQKLRLLLRFRRICVYHQNFANSFVDRVDVSRLKDAKTLFTLRGVADIMVQDLDLVKFEENCSGPHRNGSRDNHARECIARQAAALRHFNYGLQLAQSGVVVRELYTEESWRNKETWPVLQGSDCGIRKGCSCGVSKVEPAEVIEISDDSE